MEIKTTFPGGLVVRADAGNFTIDTDQPQAAGGAGSAPSPFILFLSSIATCAGYFALAFCKQREIDTAGMELNASYVRDPETHKLTSASLALTLPEGFPEKYHKALERSIHQCAVKKTILDPPEFVVTTRGQ